MVPELVMRQCQGGEGGRIEMLAICPWGELLEPLDRFLVATAAVVDQRLGKNKIAPPGVIFRACDDTLGQPLNPREVGHRVGRQSTGLGGPIRELSIVRAERFGKIDQFTAGAAVAINVAN